MSLADLSHKTGVSMSYLNEIEKGKKYPKADKIIQLAEALEVKYDWLVSLTLGHNLGALSELLESNILSELPLEIFGVGPGDLLELLSNVPEKLGAFISTLVKISRNFDIRKEEFYFAVLRSYQEMHDNYFEDIELSVEKLCIEEGITLGTSPDAAQLAKILTNRFGYTIQEYTAEERPELQHLRSVLVLKKGTKLLLNKKLTAKQKAFTLGREIAYQCLGLLDRPLTSSWVDVGSFDQVLNNFKASYFAGALLIHRQRIVSDLQAFFSQTTWNGAFLVDLMDQFNATSEIFLHRMTNIVPKYFGIKQLFFLRFDNVPGENRFMLTKEIHLSRLHTPHATSTEFYCRRWVSLTILQQLAQVQRAGKYEKPLSAAHISQYIDSKAEYLMIAIARPTHVTANLNTSVSIGFLMNDVLRSTVKFLKDPNLHIKLVNQTCERCGAFDCSVRMSEPIILQKEQSKRDLKKMLEDLQE